MNELDKIFELLDKVDLSSEEQSKLNDLLKNQPASEKIVNLYNSLKNSLPQVIHIDETLLGEYVLYKNNMLNDKGTMILLERKIEDHLKRCDKCNNVFKELNSEYADVDSFISSSFKEVKPDIEVANAHPGFFKRFNASRFAFASIIVLMIAYLGLFIISSVFTPDYKKAAISSDERDFYNTRGRTTELFQRGLNAIDKEDYNSAIKFLEEDITNNPGEASIFYSYFILGVTYIQSSESSFLGTFKSFDEGKINKGIDDLQKAIKLNNSGKYQNLNLDAHYFIGKAYLLIDKKNYAIDHLRIVIDNKGRYYKKANELLDKIGK